MDWLSAGTTGEAKRLISQLADSTKREHAAQDLFRMHADSVPALIEALQSRDPSVPPLASSILAQIGSPAIPALTKTLGNAHPLMRVLVCDILGQIKDRAAVPPLLDALRGEFYTVRARAATALGNIRDPQTTQILAALVRDREAEVRAAAALALGKFNDPSTFDELANLLLDDPLLEVRRAAASAFGETKNPTALPYLMQALRDSFWWYEREGSMDDLLLAIAAMGSDAIDSLMDALGDPEVTVRKYTAQLLGRVRDERALESLGMAIYDLNFDVGSAAAEALARFGLAGLPALKEAWKHPEASIRAHVVRALGKIPHASVVPLLLESLNDPERTVRKQAIHSLGELHDRSAIPRLQELAANRLDREMSQLAKQALQDLA